MTDVDFIARLADAWDGRGRLALRPPTDHQALLRLAGLPDTLTEQASWNELTPFIRERLVFGARIAIDLGHRCAWVFGMPA